MSKTKQFFQHWLKRGSLVPGAALLVIILGGASLSSAPSEGNGPARLKFSHQYHTKEVGAACTDCHSTASKSDKSSDNLLATMEACKTCHEDQVKSNCTYCHTSADSSTYAATPNPIREIRFSHVQHVETQKVACETCHNDLDKVVPIAENVPSMTTCRTCHNDVRAAAGCEKCHTDLAALRPADHNRSEYIREHSHDARLADAKCGSCHTQESCTDCHNGSELVKVNLPGRDLVSQHAPRLSAIDRGQEITLTKVHDLNYRFTHGVDAKAKKIECATCHSDQTFCTTCHQAGGDITQEAFKPFSHSVAGFTTIGVGSGGGEHARLAKRDIESCAACHSPEGADPVCITCHTDADGVKGTDPRTHDPGFMADTHGNWHNDPGAVCYMCHTDSNARPGGVSGQKFCGYCHQHR